MQSARIMPFGRPQHLVMSSSEITGATQSPSLTVINDCNAIFSLQVSQLASVQSYKMIVNTATLSMDENFYFALMSMYETWLCVV